MQLLVFTCPACQGKLQLKAPARPGTRVKCPKCGHAFALSPPDREHRLGALVSRWQALAAAGRDAPATELCADCPELLAELQQRLGQLRKLDALAAHDDSTPEVPDEHPTRVPGQPPIGTTPKAGEPLTHEFLRPAQQPDELGRLGPYRVLQVLGQGGMGRVYRALEPQLKRLVALKVMLPGYAADARARKRFVREAQTAAALEHDHIVPIFQVGEDNGVPFLAMPLLKGEPLSDRLRRDIRLPIDEVLRLGREVAEGLAAAHERGLVHRDIKPANIWLEAVVRSSSSQTSVARDPSAVSEATDQGRRTTDSRVKILDFGLARSAEKGEEQLTTSGMLLGTPAFMSPEQARGAAIDARSDLFSLGSVLYQMATGEQPFRGNGPMAVLTSLAVDAPRPPVLLNPLIPVALSDLILKLLEKEPQARPASAAEVAERLGAIEEERRRLAQRAAEAARRRRARRIVLAAGVLLVGLVAILFGGSIWRMLANRGELVVDVDDAEVELLVRQNGEVVQDRTRKRSFTLPAGPGEVEVYEPDGSKVATQRFTITRGGQATVTVDIVQARARVPIPVKGPPPPPPEAVAKAAFGQALLHHTNKESLAAFDALMEAVPEPAKAPWLTEQHRGKVIELTREFLATLAKDPELAAQSVAKVDSKNFPRCIHGPIALYFLDKAPPTDAAAQALQLDCRVHRVLALMQTRSPDAEKAIAELLGDGKLHGELKQRFGPAARALFLAREQYPVEEEALAAELALGYELFLRAKQLSAWLKLVEARRDESSEQLKGAWAKQTDATRAEIKRREPVAIKPKAPASPSATHFLFDPAQARPLQEAAAKELGVPVEMVNSIGLKMVLIPAATVMKDTKHFYLGIHEVTQEQYEKVMGRKASYDKGTSHPVNNITWYDAVAFCNQLSEKEGNKTYYSIDKVQNGTSGDIKSAEVSILGGEGYRLPTQIEWEFACRAGTATAYSFGDDEAQLKDYGWYEINSGMKSHPVGELKPNGFGFYDMHGNVWELCEDASRLGSYRMIGGGGYFNSVSFCRSSHRGIVRPGDRRPYVGFRLALSSVEKGK